MGDTNLAGHEFRGLSRRCRKCGTLELDYQDDPGAHPCEVAPGLILPVNEPVPLALPPGDDTPRVLLLLEYEEGFKLDDPTNAMQWIMATAKLMWVFAGRYQLLKAKYVPAELTHAIRWAIGADGDEVFIHAKVTTT